MHSFIRGLCHITVQHSTAQPTRLYISLPPSPFTNPSKHTQTPNPTQALLSEGATATLSTLLLAGICGIATQCTEEEVGFVIGVIGAVLGTGVVYIIPALINGKLLDRVKDAKAALPEKRLNKAVVAMGAVFAVLGTYAALEEHFPGLISGLWSGKAPVAKVKLH